MTLPDGTRQGLRTAAAALLPLVLWGVLWVSLQSGEFRNFYNPPSAIGFVHGIRAILPLGAAYVAVIIILYNLYRHRGGSLPFVGPLGLAAVYGLVGLVSATRSPNEVTALYWTVVYLSVPLVLWAIVWGKNGLDNVVRLINITWLIIILGVAALLAIDFLYLDLHSQILNPSAWVDCGSRKSEWFHLTSGALRATGVGRYAAIAGIIALVGLWRRNWRVSWGVALVGSVVLLWMTGARTSTLAFVVAAVLVVLVLGGRRAMVTGAIVLLLAVPLAWATGIHNTVADNCIYRGPNLAAPTVSANFSSESSTGGGLATELIQSEDGTGLATILVQPEDGTGLATELIQAEPDGQAPDRIPGQFLSLSGRTDIWGEGWQLFKESPLLGFGFHADRLKLGQHMHNAFMHSLVQTGLVGSVLLMSAFLFAWGLLLRALRNRPRLPQVHQLLVVQAGGILAFLTVRAITESSGAFFGVDWLILAPILMYLQLVDRERIDQEAPA